MAVALRRTQASAAAVLARAMSTHFKDVPMGPADPILGLTDAFNKDTFDKKVSLGVGAYRDDSGKPYVLDVVRKAEAMLVEKKMNHEYAGIAGIGSYVDLSLKFAYGKESPSLKNGLVCGVQTLSGTGACRIIGEFYNRFTGAGNDMYLPVPSWGNHTPIMRDAGLNVKGYRYYKKDADRGLDFEGMCEDIVNAKPGSCFLLHACAHNPTGVDPTPAQWDELSALFKGKGHNIFFDSAYQGFASGDAEKDAYSLRKFAADGHTFALAQSYAKNFGLYGERIGCLSMHCETPEEAKRVESQLKILIRPMYSNPPVYGARVVELILSDPEMEAQWREECKGMADRIISMRDALKANMYKLGSTQDWEHITNQIGMFCYSGLSTEQVLEIREKQHIYMTNDGRISMAGVTTGNVEYLAAAMHEVTK